MFQCKLGDLNMFFMTVLVLDKLNENGGAENIYFDWWSADNYDDDDKKVDENEDQTADKNKVNTILLNLCYKVSRPGFS